MAKRASQGTLLRLRGFTIVELLIVVVVIAILAAITIVAYNGIQNRSKQSAAQSAVSQANKKVLTYAVDNAESYPPDLATVGINNNGATTFQYSVNNASSPKTYGITATNGNFSYYVSSTSPSPIAGGYPGHGVGGVAAVTNYFINPSFETNGTGWNSYGFGTGGVGTVSRMTTGGGAIGTGYWRGAYTTAASGGSISVSSQVGSSPDVTANQQLNYSIYVRSSVSTTVSLYIDYYIKASTTFVSSSTNSSAVVNANQWTRLNVTGTVPATATVARLVISGANANLYGSTGTLDIDAAYATLGSTALYNYADGDTASWAWTGTSHGSTSTGPPQ